MSSRKKERWNKLFPSLAIRESAGGGVRAAARNGITNPWKAMQFKPDFAEAVRHWRAFLAGEIIDRPLVCVTAPKPEAPPSPPLTYRERVQAPLETVVERIEREAAGIYHGGDMIPSARLSFGPDEVACFCGATMKWSEGAGDTNWVEPIVRVWEEALPVRLRGDNPLWRRMRALYRLAGERLEGKMLLRPPDLHTNMDLLASLRGAEALCTDLLDIPETIDRAMADARAVFPELWNAIAGCLGPQGARRLTHNLYAPEGAATLQCDFSCMISPAQFRRWVVPALEEECAVVKHALYHWDGPGALTHERDVLGIAGIHTIQYVPGAGRGTHLDHVELLRRIQAAGKAVQVWGTQEELKQLHRLLRPEKTLYWATADSPAEADALVAWFRRNT